MGSGPLRRRAKLGMTTLVLLLVVATTAGAGVATESVDIPPNPHLLLLAGQFEDSTGHTFETDISWLAASGITRGCNPPANTRFCPDDPVTRGQMAAFLGRALHLPAGTDAFDDTTGHTFATDISALAAAGITRGCNPPANTRFCPDDPVTRGQMAAFLHRALEDMMPPEMEEPTTGDGVEEPDNDMLDSGMDKPSSTTGIDGDENAGEISGWAPVDDGEPGGGVDAPAATAPFGVGAPAGAALKNPPPPGTWSPAESTLTVAGGGSGLELQRLITQPIFARQVGWLPYNSLPYSVGQLTARTATGLLTSCTGTIVSRNLVLTAAHCLYDLQGRPNTDYWFQPDEYHNAWTEKRWWYAPATSARLPTAFAQEVSTHGFLQGFHRAQVLDYALIAFNPASDGRYPGDVYTPHGMRYMAPATNPPVDTQLYTWNVNRWAIGYPIEGWYNVQGNNQTDAYPWICTSDNGAWYNWSGTGLYMVVMGCTHNGGMSGGPVFANFNGETRIWGVVSSLGEIVPCTSGCLRWFGNNLWATPLINTVGPFGFDDFWNAVRVDPIAR